MKRSLTLVALLALAAGVSGCTSTTPPDEPTGAMPSTAVDSAEEAGPVELAIADPWVKATDTVMTGAFGTLANNTDEDIHVVAVTSSASDRSELHEMVEQDGSMVMVQMVDGFVIEAGGEYVLEPGANHLMLMDLTVPIEAGENVELTLEFEDGGTFSWIAPARTYAGANESYVENAPSPTGSATPAG